METEYCTHLGCKAIAALAPELRYYCPADQGEHYIPVVLHLPVCGEHSNWLIPEVLRSPHLDKTAIEMCRLQGRVLPDLERVEVHFVLIGSPEYREYSILWAKQVQVSNGPGRKLD